MLHYVDSDGDCGQFISEGNALFAHAEARAKRFFRENEASEAVYSIAFVDFAKREHFVVEFTREIILNKLIY